MQDGEGLAVHSSGDILVVGIAEGTIDFGGQPLSGAIDDDIVIARFAPNGAHVWSDRFGDSDNQRGNEVATGPHGEIYFACEASGTLDLGDVSLRLSSQLPVTAALADGGLGLWARETDDFVVSGVGRHSIEVLADGYVMTVATVSSPTAFLSRRAP